MTSSRREPELRLPFADASVAPASEKPSRIAAPAVPAPSSDEAPIGVGELDRRLRMLLERRTEGVWVHGEVSQVREVASGHVYFVLRDEGEDATIDGVLYRNAPVRSRRSLVEGSRVVVQGRATVFAPRGRLQLVVDSARPAGRGALLEALDRLRRKLGEEGLFATERKRPLPSEPRAIGVVTSADGAALHDVVKVAFRRAGVHILLARATVQGGRAAESIVRALELLQRHPGVEAIVVARGGGSVDDLAAFQDEAVVRAVATCRVPVVSAIGHEIDVTLTDLAADARAATPSQAAELLIPDDGARRERLRQLATRLTRAARHDLGRRRQRLDDAESSVRASALRGAAVRRRTLGLLQRRLAERHPRAVLVATRAQVLGLRARLVGAMPTSLRARRAALLDLERRVAAGARGELSSARESLAVSVARLDALSPLAVLGRGYAVALDASGCALVDAATAAPGDEILLRLARGRVRTGVIEVLLPEDET